MRKKALDLNSVNDYAVLIAAAAVATSFALGAGAGALASKVTEPGEYDKSNLEKEYRLARLNRDNQTQQILSDRENAERAMRGVSNKSMRIG